MSDEYTTREMRLMAERDAALTRAEQLEHGDEPTAPAPIVARTRTDLESATIEIELADADEAAAFFERIAAIIRKGSRVRVRVTAA